MAREPEEIVEMRRTLGAQLAVFRAAAELTQTQIAKAVHCDRTAVSHIEKGRARGTQRFWTIADAQCGADGALLAGFRVVTAVRQAHEVRIREAVLAETRATAQALRHETDRLALPPGYENVTSSAILAGTVDGHPRPGTVEDQAMKRREVIGLAAKIVVGASLTTADQAMLREPAGKTPIPVRIGATDVSRVEATTRILMVQDKTLGGGSCRDAVLGYLSWAEQLREAAAADSVRTALAVALARLQSLAGWTSEDLCLPLSAQRCYLRSVESARLAGEPLLTAHALGKLGGLYRKAGHYREALQIFQLGPIPAREAGSSGMLANLALHEAQAHAGLGNVDEVRHALCQADEHYTRAQEAPDEWVGIAMFPDHSDLPAERANAYSRLAEHNQRYAETAVTDMTEALALRDPSRARAMLWGRITLATNQYRCGETGLANNSTELVLTTIDRVSSRRTYRDLRTLGTEIRRNTTDSTALDLAHRISTEVAA
ncbi:MAG: helix-turn-helix transcriptional regulator [Pseudonocardiaceae bacterium]